MIHFEQIREKMKEEYEKDSSRFFLLKLPALLLMKLLKTQRWSLEYADL